MRRTRRRLAGAAGAAAAMLPLPALAHRVAAHGDASWRPEFLVLLALSLGCYLSGVRRLWAQAGPGRGVRWSEAASFVAGWLALGAALLPPVHTLGERLFSVHMVEHELLMAVAAPLLVLGRPPIAFLWALPPVWRRGLGAAAPPPCRAAWRLLTGAVVAWALHGLVLWAWHVPALFDAALTNEAVHALQHASFLAASLLYWTSLLRGGRPGVAVLSLFATTLHTGLLGALLTLGTVPWYGAYGDGGARWGLSPLEDQQLAGLMMWVPGGLIYTGAALLLAAAWLRQAEASARRWERSLPRGGGA